MRTGIELIAEERQEQIKKHGFTIEYDKNLYSDENSHRVHSDLAYAALHSLWPNGTFYPSGWNEWFKDKISKKTYKERLIIAGALIAAEIDRLQTLNPTTNE
jgi:hypothetical protein